MRDHVKDAIAKCEAAKVAMLVAYDRLERLAARYGELTTEEIDALAGATSDWERAVSAATARYDQVTRS